MNTREIVSKSILTPSKGFIDTFSHTLNPYAGCAFGCKYCYVREMPQAKFREEKWGSYVDIKSNANKLLESEIKKAKKKGSVTIFMSSSTDPYQGIEEKERITRSLVQTMLQEQIDFLHVQTRSPLVKRDIDLFQQFSDRIRISMTIETDSDEIRKVFTPSAPPIAARLNALKEISLAGIPTQASVTPLLPSSKDFAKKLREITDKVTLDCLLGDKNRSKRTEKMGIRNLFEEHGLLSWFEHDAYKIVLERLKQEFDDVDLLISDI